MATTRLRNRLIWFVVALLIIGGAPRVAFAQGAETVIEWNRILNTSIGTPGVLDATVFFTRPLAVLHTAVFDALNSFDQLYTPYLTRVDVPQGASRDAAAAQAAHDVLVGMFPGQQAVYDAALSAQLRNIPSDAAALGSQVGAATARAILQLRANDGWNRPAPNYMLPNLPGYWQPVPPQNAAATLGHYPDVTPFAIGERRFLMEAPPSLTSARYTADFNAEKAIGSATSTTRTADQTLVARLFAAVATVTTTGIPAMWSNLVRDFARSRGLDGLETARLFALSSMAAHDALYTSFSGKFLYGLWRPVTAIREAARDGNPDTEPDVNWNSLLPTPPYPTYPGNYACLSTAFTRTLTRFFDQDAVRFSMTWAAPDGSTISRTYNSLRELAEEAANSRVYGGIHFDFDTTVSRGVCYPLTDYVFDNTLRRVR